MPIAPDNDVSRQPLAVTLLSTDYFLGWQSLQTPATRKATPVQIVAAGITAIPVVVAALPFVGSVATVFTRPASAAYTTRNGTGNTVTIVDNTGGGPLSMAVQPSAADKIAVITQSESVLANAAFTITQLLTSVHTGNGFLAVGPVLTNGTLLVGCGLWNDSGNKSVVCAWTSATGSVVFSQEAAAIFDLSLPTWWKTEHSGANWLFSFSQDGGYNYNLVATYPTTFTPTQVGFGFVDARDTGGTTYQARAYLWHQRAV